MTLWDKQVVTVLLFFLPLLLTYLGANRPRPLKVLLYGMQACIYYLTALIFWKIWWVL